MSEHEGKRLLHRVMMLVHDFPPASSGGSRRPQKFATHLPGSGWTPVVITLRTEVYPRIDPATLEGLPPEVEIHRTRTLSDPRRMEEGRARAGTRTGETGALRNPVANLVREHLLVPDSRVLWWPFAAAAAIAAHRRDPVDVLWATAPPFSTALLGVRLGRRLGVPVVTDLRDPWGTAFDGPRAGESPRRKARERAQEAEVLRGSAAIVVTAPALRTSLLAGHPHLDPDRVVTITNGYDADEYEGVAPAPSDGRFRIVHTGKLVEPLYDPRCFFDALDAWIEAEPAVLERARVDLLGVISPRWRSDLEGRPASRIVHLHGHVDHTTVRAHQMAADLLVVLHGETPVIAGKTFEYLHVGAPILAIVPPDGDTAGLIREVDPGAVVALDDRDGARDVLARTFARWENGDRDRPRVDPAIIRRHDRRELTVRLADVLARVTGVDAARPGGGPGHG